MSGASPFTVQQVAEAHKSIATADAATHEKIAAENYLAAVFTSIHGWQLADNCLQV